MTSPILGSCEPQQVKRSISVLDLDHDLMGLSQNKAFDEESFVVDPTNSMALFDDFTDLRPNLSNQMPFQGSLNAEYGGRDPLTLNEDEDLFKDFPDTNNFGLRNRSMTFHLPSNSLL